MNRYSLNILNAQKLRVKRKNANKIMFANKIGAFEMNPLCLLDIMAALLVELLSQEHASRDEATNPSFSAQPSIYYRLSQQALTCESWASPQLALEDSKSIHTSPTQSQS
nr:hypothetical protein L203_05238 [Cryptococcus depauperatus CBS 7841]